MASILKSLRVLADTNRLRLLLLLEREELSWRNCRRFSSTGQSRISTHLAQLKQAGLVEDRKQGKNSLYRLKDRQLVDLLHAAAAKSPKRRTITKRCNWFSKSGGTRSAATSTNWRGNSAGTTFRGGRGKASPKPCCS